MLTPFAIGSAKSLATSVARKFPYRLNIPVSSDKYYRVVGMDAIDDANKSGLIRWKPTSTNTLQDNNLGKKSLLEKLYVGSRSGGVPYFTRGKLYMPPQQGQAVIVGNSSIPWKRIGSKGRINRYSQEDPIRIGNSATPYIDHQFNTASVKNFEYWTRGSNPVTKYLFKRRQFESPTTSQLSNSSALSNNSSVSSDALNLHFQRLKNGGYDKLEKQLQDYMANNPLSSGFLQFRDNGRIVEIPFVRKNLRDQVSIETPQNPNSIFTEQDLENAGGAIAFTSQGMIEYSPEALLKNGYDISRSLSHEVDHALHIPLEKPQGFDLSKLSKEDQLYFTKFRGTELSSRGSQIKDWLKFNRADQNITENDLKNAAQNYINDTGMNNKMTQFFNSISDYQKAAEWLSEYSTGLSIPIILNKNE